MRKVYKRCVVASLKTLARAGLIKEHTGITYDSEMQKQIIPCPDVETQVMRFKVEIADKAVIYKHKRWFSTKGGRHIYAVTEKLSYGKVHQYRAIPKAFCIEYDGQLRWVGHEMRPIRLVEVASENQPVIPVDVNVVEFDVGQNYYIMSMAIDDVPDYLIAEIMDINYKKFSDFLKKQPLRGRRDGATNEQ